MADSPNNFLFDSFDAWFQTNRKAIIDLCNHANDELKGPRHWIGSSCELGIYLPLSKLPDTELRFYLKTLQDTGVTEKLMCEVKINNHRFDPQTMLIGDGNEQVELQFIPGTLIPSEVTDLVNISVRCWPRSELPPRW